VQQSVAAGVAGAAVHEEGEHQPEPVDLTGRVRIGSTDQTVETSAVPCMGPREQQMTVDTWSALAVGTPPTGNA